MWSAIIHSMQRNINVYVYQTTVLCTCGCEAACKAAVNGFHLSRHLRLLLVGQNARYFSLQQTESRFARLWRPLKFSTVVVKLVWNQRNEKWFLFCFWVFFSSPIEFQTEQLVVSPIRPYFLSPKDWTRSSSCTPVNPFRTTADAVLRRRLPAESVRAKKKKICRNKGFLFLLRLLPAHFFSHCVVRRHAAVNHSDIWHAHHAVLNRQQFMFW